MAVPPSRSPGLSGPPSARSEPAAGPAPVAILAGGRSRRMGAPKALVPLAGRSLLAHAIVTARAAGLPPLVVAKAATPLGPLDVPRCPEPDQPQHPLAGVAAALRWAGRPLVTLPVDMPLVPPGLLTLLAARPEPLVIVRAGGRIHPLLARFDPTLLDALDAAAAAGAPVVGTLLGLGAAELDDADLTPFGDPTALLVNVNRPEQLAALEDVVRGG